jgi:hypothetical protein
MSCANSCGECSWCDCGECVCTDSPDCRCCGCTEHRRGELIRYYEQADLFEPDQVEAMADAALARERRAA